MKTCANCGAQLEDISFFCSSCGTSVAEPAPVCIENNIPAELPVSVADQEPAAVCQPPKKNKKKLLLILILGIVALLLIAAIVAAIVMSTIIMDPIELSVDVHYGFCYSKIKEMAPEEYWDFVEKENPQFSIDKAVAQYERQNKAELDLRKDLYGDDIMFSYIITKYDPMNKGMLDTIADYLDDTYDIKARSVTSGCQIWYDYTLRGESYMHSIKSATAMLIQIDGKWYSIKTSSHDGELIVNFDIPYFVETYILEHA